MTITIGGKPIKGTLTKQIRDGWQSELPSRVGKHRQLTTAQIAQRHPAEPFPPIDVFRSQPVAERISIAADLRMWVEHYLDQMVPVAQEEAWLRLQLRDPALEGHRMRQDALERLQGMVDQLADYACATAMLEAHSDRIWQSLAPADRGDMATRWMADVTEPRLILNAWTRIAQVGFAWPENYTMNLKWFHGLPEPILEDMKQHGMMKTTQWEGKWTRLRWKGNENDNENQ